jgi:hypothetical protein
MSEDRGAVSADGDGTDPQDEERRRAAALLAGLDFGDWSGLVATLAADLAPVYADGLRAAGFGGQARTRNEARATLGLPPLPDDAGGDEVPDIVDDLDNRADGWAQSQAADLVPGLKERSRGMLETTVLAALAALAANATAGGFTAAQLVAAVAEAPAFNRARADRIAQNEVTQAEREGLNVAMRNSRVAPGKVWRTQEDDAVEADCEENADAGVIAIADDWPNGDYPHPNCRCWYELADLDEDEE